MSGSDFEKPHFEQSQENLPTAEELPPLPEWYDHTVERSTIDEEFGFCAIARRRYSQDAATLARLDELEAGLRERLRVWEARGLPYDPPEKLDPLFGARLDQARAGLELATMDGYFGRQG